MKLENHITNIKLDCAMPALKDIGDACFHAIDAVKALKPHIESIIIQDVKWETNPMSDSYIVLDVLWPQGTESWVIKS